MPQLIVLGSMFSYPRGTNPEAKATGTIAEIPTSTESAKRKVAGLFGDIPVDANLIMIAQNKFQKR